MISTSSAAFYLGSIPIGSSALGGPGAPVNLVQNGAVISFDAGEEGDAGPTLAYAATIEPEGPTLEVTSDDPAVGGQVRIVGPSVGVQYVVSIFGVNRAGKGKEADIGPFVVPFNEATGGSTKIEENYNGTGEDWRVHSFTSNGTFTVTSDAYDFRVLLVGGGECSNSGSGNGGFGGVVYENLSETLLAGDYSVIVGSGGGRNSGNAGGPSHLGDLMAAGGNRDTGTGNPGGNAWGNAGSTGTSSNITGTSLVYADGGGAGGRFNSGYGTQGAVGGSGLGGRGGHSAGDLDPPGTKADSDGKNATGANRGCGGGGRGQAGGDTGTSGTTGAGTPGVVVIAYRIG